MNILPVIFLHVVLHTVVALQEKEELEHKHLTDALQVCYDNMMMIRTALLVVCACMYNILYSMYRHYVLLYSTHAQSISFCSSEDVVCAQSTKSCTLVYDKCWFTVMYYAGGKMGSCT